MVRRTASPSGPRSNLGLAPAPHLYARLTTGRLMLITALCLLPVALVQLYFLGCGLIWQFLIIYVTATLCEAAVSLLRHRPLKQTASDCSTLVTSALLALTVPPLLPWHLSCVCAAFAIVIVKECFGGLGMNIFNPAMAGFVFLLISAPGYMFSTFVPPAEGAFRIAGLGATYEVVIQRQDPAPLQEKLHEAATQTDALSGATFLEGLKTSRKSGSADSMVNIPDFTTGAALYYSAQASACAAGGLVLMIMRIIMVKMVLCYFLAVAGFSYLGHLWWPGLYLPELPTLLVGGTALAGFFIITDPVTNAGTGLGRISYAILVAFLIVVLRALGSYSDSVAFAVLLGNAAAPLIDVLTRRRPYGVGYRRGELL